MWLWCYTSETSTTAENRFPSSVDDDGNSQPGSSGNRRLSDINEPTKQSVAARLATWKKRTAAVENASTPSLQHFGSRDKLHTISEVGGERRQLLSDKARPVDTEIRSNTSSRAPVKPVSSGKASDSVPATDNGGGKTSFPPLKDGEVRQRTLPRSKKQEAVQPSWKKLGPATFEIQQKLTAMCENWKKNEIAAKSRIDRAEDLAVVENRWRNGILADEQKDAVAAAVPLTDSTIASHIQVD